jgi:hypothetical protein
MQQPAGVPAAAGISFLRELGADMRPFHPLRYRDAGTDESGHELQTRLQAKKVCGIVPPHEQQPEHPADGPVHRADDRIVRSGAH